jgi:Domain of unknown function (DUF4190)/DUF1707 SHOCT-like domain
MMVDPMSAARFAAPPGNLAANADRDRAIDVLKAGFAEGRLTKDEYDDRTARVYTSRTYGELGPLIVDLPAGPLGAPVQYPVALHPGPRMRPPVNSTAVASLTCGIAVFLTMGLTAIPALVLGHSARRQMRQSGERGDGMALTGMALGWAGVVMMAVALAGLLAVVLAVHNVHQPVVHPMPAIPGGPMKPVDAVIVVGN